MFKVYFFLKRNRIRKKWKLYKQLIQITIDATTAFYSLLVISYFIVAFLLEGNPRALINEMTIHVEAITEERFWSVVTLLPFIYIISSFNLPGVVFSTAEYALTVLPHSTRRIWLFTAVERWVMSFIKLTVGGTVIYLFTPMNITLITTYYLLFLFMNVVMTTIQWKVFQLPFIWKIIIMIMFININLLAFIFPSSVIGMLFIIILLIVNVYVIPKLFDHIDWKKVTAIGDFKLWNMMIISNASGVKFKKERQYSIWQRFSFWKKPFLYEKESAYNRLWYLYIEKHIAIILQVIGTLLVMLFVFLYIKKILFIIGLTLTLHMYTTFFSTLFKDRLKSDIVEILPWDVVVFKRTFMKWVLVSSIIFLVPYSVYAVTNFTYWIFLQFILMIGILVILMSVKLDKVIYGWDKKFPYSELVMVIGYVLLLVIMISEMYPVLLFVGLACLGIVFLLRKQTQSMTDTQLL